MIMARLSSILKKLFNSLTVLGKTCLLRLKILSVSYLLTKKNASLHTNFSSTLGSQLPFLLICKPTSPQHLLLSKTLFLPSLSQRHHPPPAPPAPGSLANTIFDLKPIFLLTLNEEATPNPSNKLVSF